MRKLKAILLILTLVFSIGANAQIQREFFGGTLGRTGLNKTLTHLKKRGFDPVLGKEWLKCRNVVYGGVCWDYLWMSFYKNKLEQVILSKTYPARTSVYKDSLLVSDALNSRYSRYYLPASKKIPNFECYSLYTDFSTKVMWYIAITEKSEFELTLSYNDTNLEKKHAAQRK